MQEQQTVQIKEAEMTLVKLVEWGEKIQQQFERLGVGHKPGYSDCITAEIRTADYKDWFSYKDLLEKSEKPKGQSISNEEMNEEDYETEKQNKRLVLYVQDSYADARIPLPEKYFQDLQTLSSVEEEEADGDNEDKDLKSPWDILLENIWDFANDNEKMADRLGIDGTIENPFWPYAD